MSSGSAGRRDGACLDATFASLPSAFYVHIRDQRRSGGGNPGGSVCSAVAVRKEHLPLDQFSTSLLCIES